jgi:hypothetical protein
MKIFITFTLVICGSLLTAAKAQPYIDPLNIRHTSAFRNKNKNGTPFTHIYIGSDLPVKFKKNVVLVFSPFYENWNIDSAGNHLLRGMQGVAFPVSLIIPLNKAWSLTFTGIPRFNSEDLKVNNSSFQWGNVFLATFGKQENLKYKFGVYVNSQFFGLFVIPLAGIDWKINEKNNLFGVLPGRLTYEHKFSRRLYGGATFRAITNSYRLNTGNYLRVDDNQLSAFLDLYPAKNIVFTLEPGYGIMRKLRSGKERNKKYIRDYNWGDGLFLRLSASYRIRL